jgi:hypothetical protein
MKSWLNLSRSKSNEDLVVLVQYPAVNIGSVAGVWWAGIIFSLTMKIKITPKCSHEPTAQPQLAETGKIPDAYMHSRGKVTATSIECIVESC